MAPRPDGQRLERREATAGGGVGPARLDSAALPGRHWRAAGDRKRVPAGSGGPGAAAAGWGRWPPASPANGASTDPAAPPSSANDPSTDSGPVSKPANEASTDPAWPPRPGRAPAASACEPYREFIEVALAAGRYATAIWQDLVDDHRFGAGYASVKRSVARLKAAAPPEAHPSIFTPPGEEEKVDCGEGPMVRHSETGEHRRARLFVMTLGYSRKAVRPLTFKSSVRIWAELHERAFRRLGGAPRVVVLANLKEGVLEPEVYDPILNPRYRDLLKHCGAVGLPARVNHPDRKGTVESGVGHAQKTPLKGLRFETIEEAQAYPGSE